MDPEISPTSLYGRIGGRPRLMHLLRHFYADVRQHRVIGPIFAAQIKDWPTHLEKIADFWSNVTGGPIRYEGAMPQKHFPLGLQEVHFETWLDLWQQHCRMHLPPAEAAELIAAAETIGQRLRWLIANQPPRSNDVPGADG
jgi:hemoglobin